MTEPSAQPQKRPFPRALRLRRGAAQLLELAGFAAIVAGVDQLFGVGAALVAAGVLAVLAAFGVDR